MSKVLTRLREESKRRNKRRHEDRGTKAATKVSGNKLLAIELRVSNPITGTQDEVQIIPLDVELPVDDEMMDRGYQWTMNCTMHTTKGDANAQFTVQV